MSQPLWCRKTSKATEHYVKDLLPQLQHQQAHSSQISTELMTQIIRRRLGGHITTHHHYCGGGLAGVFVHSSCSNQNISSLLSLWPSSAQALSRHIMSLCLFVSLASFPGFHSNHNQCCIVCQLLGIL